MFEEYDRFGLSVYRTNFPDCHKRFLPTAPNR